MSNHSPTMSARSNPLSIGKSPSSENVCKSKDDRSRCHSIKYKQRTDNGSNSHQLGNTNNRQSRNAKGQCSYYQKQPQPRNTWGGKRTKVTVEQREEMGGGKVNLNHLLNFTFEQEEARHPAPRIFSRAKSTNKDIVYNKEHFIQANCQLIIKEGVDCSAQLVNNDSLIDWEYVEKVNIWKEEVPTCPICLSEFCAARITKCGHIYCWPCILHYLALDEKTWRKCPICHEAVHKKDLKSVTVHEDVSFKVQDVITMQLMKRQRDAVFATRVDQKTSNACYQFDDTATPQEQRHLKYMIANKEQVSKNIVENEIYQLEFKLATETDEFEKTFIEAALALCKQRELDLDSGVELLASSADVEQNQDVCKDMEQFVSSEVPVANPEDGEDGGRDCCDDEEISNVVEDRIYFYQAEDGQHIYLHRLNMRSLLHQYGSYEKCPHQITAKIMEMEEITMNDVTRKRHRHLSHLPLSLEFRIAELDLRPPLVSMATLAEFRDALERRAATRRKKARDEKRILKKAQNEALRKQGKYPAARICLESQQQFPEIQQHSSSGSFSVLLPSPGTTPSNDSIISSVSSLSLSPEENVASSSGASGISFAQMLRSSKADEQLPWTRRTPTSRHAPPAPVVRRDVGENLDEDEEEFAAPPTYQSSFGDALSRALENVTPVTKKGGKSKKGKKGKGVVLFSNCGPRP